ncbi:neutral/alkaline non-lysosomal ceramidase N-terminal domain-containing protein [Fodinibius sediminis]|uniref:Neutral ceramidase n=1 Tax=Fodinibius sediminis TaxID=1214077 RepID=A0A521DPG9_9BACT|nr:neutral/alkaline non-lysosomal ceramidase N-terminal domain-containing protein [Fodinibius sediminis]SMO73619.1 Neutral/alkaline non-lysosomal ceramidase, N-terminal [Fodinibius sediminis]
MSYSNSYFHYHTISFLGKKTLSFAAMVCLLLLLSVTVRGEGRPVFHTDIGNRESMQVGVARVDITPEAPIRLAGYGSRQGESEGVLQRLEAKALAFGSDRQGPSLLITVDLIGIPGHITTALRNRLKKKAGIQPEQLTIAASHTHSGPEIGTLLNHFGEPLPVDQLGRIVRYLDGLTDDLEEVALAALQNRSTSFVAWGQGQVEFAVNRRLIEDGRWVGFGVVPEGPVDHTMPLLRITDPEGNIRALLINYACHGTTLGPDVNKVHGDWMGEAQRIIEERHPGAMAMVAIGAGADANPEPRLELEHTTRHGKEIADEVDRLLNTPLEPLSVPPTGNYQEIELPYAEVPTINDLIDQAAGDGAKGYYARLALERMARGESIPSSLTYPVQTWTFGNDLAMVLMAGEVVADYSLRLKKELDAERLWVTAYANDVPSYISSRRIIREGGYEVESSMYSYDNPSPFSEEIEELIINAIHELLPPSFASQQAINQPAVVRGPAGGAILTLNAESGRAIGPEIEYMPEWRAFGWFTADDRVEWDVEVNRRGRYEVSMEWSVSDEEAGKPFVFQVGEEQIRGTVERTGSWEDFKTTVIGTIQLDEGAQKMTFKPGSYFEEGALLDLRALHLTPVE